MRNRNNRLVVTLGNTEENVESANLLGRAFFNTDEVKVLGFEDKSQNFFNEIPDIELSDILFLGHGSRKQYDKHSARSFANKFSELFAASRKSLSRAALKQSKQSIKHVYLVGCELGLIDDKGKSLAQQIAAQLHGHGFTEVLVHAYAAIQTEQYDSLIVKVINHEGLSGFLSRASELAGGADEREMIKIGHIAAEIINKNGAALRLLSGAAPKQELDRPVNTFGPKPESLEQRTERVDLETIEKEIHTRAEAIALLYKRTQYLKYMASTNIAKKVVFQLKFTKLTKYSRALNNAVNATQEIWKQTLLYILGKIKSKPLLFKQGGNTENLVRALSNRNNLRVSELVINQDINESMARNSRNSQTPSTITNPEADKPMQARQSDRPTANPDDALSLDLQKRINLQIQTLAQEINDISRGCFGFFRCRELNLKIDKHNALLAFFDQTKDGICVKRAKAYRIALDASKNERVMRGKKLHRTHDLIHDISMKHEHLPADLSNYLKTNKSL